MKKVKISFIVALVLMVASLGSTQSMAQGRGKCDHHGQYGMQGNGVCKGDKNMAFINDLTPEQEKQIDALKINLTKESISTKNLIAEKQAHLKTVSTGENVDMVAVNKTIDEIFVLKAEMTKKHEAFRQDVRKLLTADQKVMFDIHSGKGQGAGMGHGCKNAGNSSCQRMGNGGQQGCMHMGHGAGDCTGKCGAGCSKGNDGANCYKKGSGHMNGCQGQKAGCKGNIQGCQGQENGKGCGQKKGCKR
jgi:Spy/CpxP family protein refolding chaperone